MKRAKGTVTLTVVVLLCTAMFSLLSLSPVSAAKPETGLAITFVSPNGTSTADANGLTYFFDGNVAYDPSMLYAEAYWGEYPLYLPGNTVMVNHAVTYTGPAEHVTLRLVTVTYAMNTDGSNGLDLNNTSTDITAVTQYVPIAYDVPMAPKGLYRHIAQLSSVKTHGKKTVVTLLKTTEAIFCPPPAQ